MRVLVVTDDPVVREQARYGFPSGVDVDLAIEARDAWEALEEDVPAAIVVDMQTGSAGGFALSRDVLATERLAGVPVLILLQRVQDAWLARKAGARAYRVKPLGGGELARETLALVERATAPPKDAS
ncbi:MAG: response regulator [Actinomycetota bacterium]